MASILKHYTLPLEKAKIFRGPVQGCGLANMGYNFHPSEGWTAYHHHDSGTSLAVDYDPKVDEDNAKMRVRGLEGAIQETLEALKKLNLEIADDN